MTIVDVRSNAMLHLEIVGSKPRPVLPLNFTLKTPVSNTATKAGALASLRRRLHNRLSRGLSHSVDNGATRDKPEDTHPALSYITENTNSSAHLSSYEGTPSESGRSSPSDTASQGTLSVSNCWASGNSTERSSIDSTYSWADDEFDRHAARNVARLFDQIDSIMYEDSSTGPSEVFKECTEWVRKFPHLRVLGKQLQAPRACGFVAIPRSSDDYEDETQLDSVFGRNSEVDRELDAVLGHDYITDTTPTSSLTINGDAISAKPAPSNLPRELLFLQEEVIVKDGYYEEILAIDNSDLHEDLHPVPTRRKSILPRWKRLGFPPITPTACLHDSVMSTVFDYIWQEVFDWTGDLIKRYSSTLLEDKVDIVSLQHTPGLDDFSQQQLDLLSHKVMGSNSLNTEMRQAHLDDLLTVSRKELVLREKSSLHEISETPQPFNSRPISVASKRPLRPASVQRDFSDHLVMSVTRRGGHSIRAGLGVRLTPLAPHILDRSRTPSVEDSRSQQMQNEVLVGHRLIIGSEGIASPTSVLARHSTLPPLDVPKRSSTQNRASSALLSDKETRLSYKERYLQLQEPMNRPSTTHAFRSDTPLGSSLCGRRSSTPMGLYTMTARTQHIGRNKYLGITGSGLQPHSDLDHIEQEDETDPVHLSDPVVHAHHQWTPMTAAPRNNRYGRGKQLTSYLRV